MRGLPAVISKTRRMHLNSVSPKVATIIAKAINPSCANGIAWVTVWESKSSAGIFSLDSETEVLYL